MKVFVSSVVDGYEGFRAAAKDAIEALGHQPVLMEHTQPASPKSPREACLGEVADSDAVVFLIGHRYGTVLESGKSATHEEWDHARCLHKEVLVFVEKLIARDDHQNTFLEQVSDWDDGRQWVSYSEPIDLLPEIVKALHLLQPSPEDTEQDPADKLPQGCRERIEQLRNVSPSTANRLLSLLSDPASRTAGILRSQVENPPYWLREAGAVAWDAIVDFMGAHELVGADLAKQTAIEVGSSRSAWYRITEALEEAERGNQAQAEGLLAQVPGEYPLLTAVRALMSEDFLAAVNAIETEDLTRSEDPDLALFSTLLLITAHMHLENYSLAADALRTTNEQFPDRAGLLLHHANATLGMADKIGPQSPGAQDLLGEAVVLALRSRDCFRNWGGPSYRAVTLATRTLLALDDPQRVLDLATGPPDGEAIAAEAAAPDVQRNLAHAYLMLGRPHDIDTLRLEGVDPSEAARIRALQANILGDASALSRMRTALAHADDKPARLRALFGLALMGEVDDAALEELPEAETALFRGVAASTRGDHLEAIDFLLPYRFESPIHAHYLAQAQHQTGETSEAVETLTNAAEHLGALLLLEPAADMLFEQGQFEKAETMVTQVLAMGPSHALKKRMKILLVEIAQQLQDWQTMESYAQSLVREFPDDDRAPWMVVYALHRQGKIRHAWGYLVGRDLTPFSEETAQLAVAVCGAVDAPEQATERLLDIAGMYPESEQVVGSAIVTLLTQGDRRRLSTEQLSRLHELTDDFVARHPESEVFRARSAEQPEELIETMVASLKSLPEHHVELVNRVRFGRLPYGTLLFLRPDLPYTDVLLSVAADWLTAIPADPEQRARERNTAYRALGGEVAVDTSVVALGVVSGLDVTQFGTVFKTVRVADELLIDARWAVSVARTPVTATLGYDPVADRPTMTETNEDQRRTRLQRAESALDILSGWQSVISGPLRLRPDYDENDFRPWDASLRVASSVDNCALWCDDVALRAVAEAEGIPSFSTWALYEALSERRREAWFPSSTEVKMRLLRARIADVPISLSELTLALDDSDGPYIAAASFLSRPQVWQDHISEVLRWHLERGRQLKRGPHQQWIPVLVHASCRGLGAATPQPNRAKVMGGFLASALFNINDPAMVPDLLVASRYAASALNPLTRLDPLPDAIRSLLTSLEPAIGSEAAAGYLMELFSKADPPDRRTVTAIIIENR